MASSDLLPIRAAHLPQAALLELDYIISDVQTAAQLLVVDREAAENSVEEFRMRREEARAERARVAHAAALRAQQSSSASLSRLSGRFSERDSVCRCGRVHAWGRFLDGCIEGHGRSTGCLYRLVLERWRCRRQTYCSLHLLLHTVRSTVRSTNRSTFRSAFGSPSRRSRRSRPLDPALVTDRVTGKTTLESLRAAARGEAQSAAGGVLVATGDDDDDDGPKKPVSLWGDKLGGPVSANQENEWEKEEKALAMNDPGGRAARQVRTLTIHAARTLCTVRRV